MLSGPSHPTSESGVPFSLTQENFFCIRPVCSLDIPDHIFHKDRCGQIGERLRFSVINVFEYVLFS